MKKKIGAVLFLVCSIVNIVLAFMFKSNLTETMKFVMAILGIVAVVGAVMTGSKGVVLYIIGWVLVFLGTMTWIPNATVCTVLRYAGQIINIVAIVFIWKDSIKDIFAK